MRLLSWRLAAIALLPGGLVIGAIALGVWLRRRWIAQDLARVEALIDGNRAKQKPGHDRHDDTLRQKSEARRDVADRMRQRAAKVETGASAGAVIRDASERFGGKH